MGIKVRGRPDGTIAGTELPDDGTLAEVVVWRHCESRVGCVVRREGSDLVFVGYRSHCTLPDYFLHHDTPARLRLLEPGVDVLEITED